MRLGGRVRGFAQEFHIEVDHGKHERVDLVAVAGVIHKCGVDALECAALHEVDLAIAALLRGATDESHAAADAIERVTDGEEGSDRGRSHQVVPAAMSDPGQRVVLAEDRDQRTTGAGLGEESRLEARGPALDRDLLRLQVIRERGRRKAFLERELRPRVDLEREPVERLRAHFDALGYPLLPRRGVQVALRLTRTRASR